MSSRAAGGAMRARRPLVRSARLWVPLGVFVAFVIGGGLGAWTLYQAANDVRADLEAARAELATAQSAVAAGDTTRLVGSVDAAVASADKAVIGTRGWLWALGEAIPGLGENFRAVRVIAESTQTVTAEVGQPGVAIVARLSSPIDPATGGFDVTVIREARDLTATTEQTFDRVVADLGTLDADATIGQIASAAEEFVSLIDSARSALPPIEAGISAASMILGVDGPRTIDLAFMNSAEASGLGGGPSAQMLMSADEGHLSFGQQPSSASFRNGVDLGLPIEDPVRQLYNTILTDNINASTSRPDLPYSASILNAWLQRDLGVTVDGIVLADPMALAAILSVTGPVALPDGTQLDAGNAVSMLLNEAYLRFSDPLDQDAFFKAAAFAVFEKLLSGGFELRPMLSALTTAANNGSLMVWSADPVVQSALDGTRLQGTLPTSNADASVIGVYFRDRSSSKSSYYLSTATTVTTNTCAPEAPTYTVEVTLGISLPPGVELPPYAYSQLYDFWRTEVFVYGPVGGSGTAATIPVPARSGETGPAVDDLGRPVVKFTIDSDDGQQATVSATFAGRPGDVYAPTEVRTTPMINPTTVTLVQANCG
ncbi:DUF4012 domain-containing protein [Luethyella okanaganae]|uniref:DUF4012 domain-containing protein n=1 Tax=Luethyella okanaganae TaxID=69372 RepID=A0ABW1VCV9_9MICO